MCNLRDLVEIGQNTHPVAFVQVQRFFLFFIFFYSKMLMMGQNVSSDFIFHPTHTYFDDE